MRPVKEAFAELCNFAMLSLILKSSKAGCNVRKPAWSKELVQRTGYANVEKWEGYLPSVMKTQVLLDAETLLGKLHFS